MMKHTIFCLIFFGIVSCAEQHKHGHGHSPQNHGGPDHGSANAYMYQSSVENLIKRFESKERDAYQKPDLVMGYFGHITGKTVMDIGAGSGYFSVRLAKKGAKVIAADVDDEFLSHIEERIKQEKIASITTRKIPYDSPNLKDHEVHMVLVVNTYHHIENRENYFKEVLKGTKEGGELVIIDFFDTDIPVGPKHHKIGIDTAVAELKKAGYSHFEVEVNLLPYQYIIKAKGKARVKSI